MGTIIALPLMDWLPVNVPPLALDTVAVQAVALAEVHVSDSP